MNLGSGVTISKLAKRATTLGDDALSANFESWTHIPNLIHRALTLHMNQSDLEAVFGRAMTINQDFNLSGVH